jgi:hypothetical protein
LDYPKEYNENVRYRAHTLEAAEKDPTLQAVLMEKCRRDRLFWINTFVWTYNPRLAGRKHIPFITYPFQDKTILWDAQCALDGEDNLVEKTRDMGATWMLLLNDLHDWLFSAEKIETLWGSWKEEYVDQRGNAKSIFEKFRYALRHLPPWMYPKTFEWTKHDCHLRLINPDTGSVIGGESTNNNFGRGDRKYRIRFDEFAFWECAVNAWEGTADTTKCRTALSTPNGSSNKFALLANGKSGQIKKCTLHWTVHPEKVKGAYYLSGEEKIYFKEKDDAFKLWDSGRVVVSPWYEEECSRRDEAAIAQELDIDYRKSGNPYFDLQALYLQKVWEYRKRGQTKLPWGYYFRANLVEVNNKVELRESPDGWLRIFEAPEQGCQYVLGADTSEGLPKGDKNFGIVRDSYTRNTVATIIGLHAPDDYAYKLWLIHRYYNNCLLAPENNNHGYAVCNDLDRLGTNLYRSKPEESISGVSKRGWTTSPKSRPVMLTQMKEEIRLKSVELRDPDLISECEFFITNKSGKPEADGDFHDDGVLAFAIAGAVIDKIGGYNPKRSSDIRAKRKSFMEKRKKRNAGMAFASK